MATQEDRPRISRDNLGELRDGILQWLLIYDKDFDDYRHCCGMTKTEPDKTRITFQEDPKNLTNTAFLFANGLTDINHHIEDHPNKTFDSLGGVNIDSRYARYRSDLKAASVDTTPVYGNEDINDTRLMGVNNEDSSSMHDDTLPVKPGVIDGLIESISSWLFSFISTRSTEHLNNYADDLTIWATVENSSNSYFGHFPPFFTSYFSVISDKDQNDTTGDVCQDVPLCAGYKADSEDETNVDDSMTFMIIRLLLPAILYKYKFTRTGRLGLPKGVTLTHVLYRRGKHLELGLSKYLRHRSVSKSQIVFTSSFYPSDVNYNRPGLELTRRFNSDFPWLEPKQGINRSYLQHNLPVPGSINTPRHFLPLTGLVNRCFEVPPAARGLIKSPVGPRLNPLSTMSLPMICDREDRKPQTSQQQTTDRKTKSLETQFIQLNHNINYLASNTAYSEKMMLLLGGYLIRTYTNTGAGSPV